MMSLLHNCLYMVFTAEDFAIIKFFFVLRNSMVQKELLLSVHLEVEHVIRKIDKTGWTKCQVGSGSPRSVRCSETISEVEDLILSQQDKPQSHSTQPEISWQLNILLGSVSRIVKQVLRLKCFKKCMATKLTAGNKITHFECSKQLLKSVKCYPASLINFIFFTDEKLFTIACPSNSQNDQYTIIGVNNGGDASPPEITVRGTPMLFVPPRF